jgi:Zn-dependent protease
VEFVPAWGIPSREAIEMGSSRLEESWLVIGTLLFERFQSDAVNMVVRMLLWINIFWGLINLLPVYPLDGGQIAREVFMLGHHSARDGMVRSLQLSIGVAAVAAALGIVWLQSLFTALLFGFLAYDSYRALQAYTGRGPGYGWG